MRGPLVPVIVWSFFSLVVLMIIFVRMRATYAPLQEITGRRNRLLLMVAALSVIGLALIVVIFSR